MRRSCRPPLCAAIGTVWLLASLSIGTAVRAQAEIVYREVSGSLNVENRWYPQTGAHHDQRSLSSGFVAAPQLYLEDDQERSFTLEPFFRYDSGDPRRTHFDLRQAYLLFLGEFGSGEWEVRLGFDRVFWGVAETRNLVDIVNQVDLIEHPDEKTRLGQPMLHVTWSGDWGVFEVFGLPYHRARTLSGRKGRPRLGIVVDDDHIEYESSAEEWHMDVAARYSHSFGPLDLGLSVFEGTSRDPFLIPGPLDASGRPEVLIQYYEQIRQFGLDAQLILGSWLLKLEAIERQGARNLLGREEDFAAFVVGGEYTFHSVLGSVVDVGVILEWNHDRRGRTATDKFQDDVFVGARVAFNDLMGTEILASFLVDADQATRAFAFEMSRRLTDRWSLSLEALVFFRIAREDILYDTRRDSFADLKVIYHF